MVSYMQPHRIPRIQAVLHLSYRSGSELSGVLNAKVRGTYESKGFKGAVSTMGFMATLSSHIALIASQNLLYNV